MGVSLGQIIIIVLIFILIFGDLSKILTVLKSDYVESGKLIPKKKNIDDK